MVDGRRETVVMVSYGDMWKELLGKNVMTWVVQIGLDMDICLYKACGFSWSGR